MCILVVDDDELVRSTAVSVLQDAGHETIEAGDVAMAFAILAKRAETITHVFTDVRMPGWQDGVDLAIHLRNEFPGIEVVITSGYHDHETDAVDEGVRFLPKPWAADDVLAIVGAKAEAEVR